MLSPALLALALVLVVVLLAPTERLRRAGWPPRALGGYLLAMVLLGLLASELVAADRLLVPILVVGYLAPFVAARAGLDRLAPFRRASVSVERPPIKHVEGPSRDVPHETPVAPSESESGRTSRRE